MKRIVLTVRNANAIPGTLGDRAPDRLIIEEVDGRPEIRFENRPPVERGPSIVVRGLFIEVEESP